MLAKHKPSEWRFRLEEYRLKRRLMPSHTGLTLSNFPIRFLQIPKRLFHVPGLAEQQEKLEYGGNIPSLGASNNFCKRTQAATPRPCEVLSVSF